MNDNALGLVPSEQLQHLVPHWPPTFCRRLLIFEPLRDCERLTRCVPRYCVGRVVMHLSLVSYLSNHQSNGFSSRHLANRTRLVARPPDRGCGSPRRRLRFKVVTVPPSQTALWTAEIAAA